MLIERLELQDFRNYSTFERRFASRKVILLGKNGQGKTNLLEAIAVLATGSSPFASRDTEMIKHGSPRAIVRATICRRYTTANLDLLIPKAGRRAVKLDGCYQRRRADILGVVMVVVFTRQDLELARGLPSLRRDYLDGLLVQLHPLYHSELQSYSRVLVQRNQLLRRIREEGMPRDVLLPWDELLVGFAATIARRRMEVLEGLVPLAKDWYLRISSGAEALSISYLSGVTGDRKEQTPHLASAASTNWNNWGSTFAEVLRVGVERDVARGQTSAGPHRDDLVLLLDGRETRAYASTGQLRTIALALKLAQLDMMRQASGESPILLLDDVLAELDLARQNQLLDAVGKNAQTFVTSTHLSDFNPRWIDEAEVYEVIAGTVERNFGGAN